MRYRQLGQCGLTVSVVGLGCNNFGGRVKDVGVARAIVDAALDDGVTLLDTSNTYGNKGGSEAALGEILGSRRDRVVLATKWGHDMGEGPGTARGSRRYIRRAVEGSLRRLQTDYIDLYQLHEPDALTPISETLGALDDLIHEGKVRYIGSSNFAGWQVADAEWTARTAGTERMISAQNLYSLLERDAETGLLDACAHLGVGFLPFFPLAKGLLTGKYRRDQPPPEGTRLAGQAVEGVTFDRLEAFTAFAEERGHSLLELAIAALAARRPVASVIAGATKPEQVHANVAAGEWVLDDDDLAALDTLGKDPT